MKKSYIKHDRKRLPVWIQKLNTYTKCALRACKWEGGRVFGVGDNGTFIPLRSYGTFESYGRCKAMTPILGTKEDRTCSCTFVCLCVVGKGKKVYMCLWEWKRVSEIVRVSHIHTHSPIFFFLFANQGVPWTFSARQHVFGLGRPSGFGISLVSWDRTQEV